MSRQGLLCEAYLYDALLALANRDSARTRALASNILVGAGVALAAAGVVLYVTAPSKAEKAGIAVIPMASPSELGMAVTGGF